MTTREIQVGDVYASADGAEYLVIRAVFNNGNGGFLVLALPNGAETLWSAADVSALRFVRNAMGWKV